MLTDLVTTSYRTETLVATDSASFTGVVHQWVSHRDSVVAIKVLQSLVKALIATTQQVSVERIQ